MDDLREKLLHYTDDLSEAVDLRREAIATIEQAAQYMTEDELLHHSRALALAYLALTDAADVAPVVRCKDCKHKGWVQEPCHGKSADYCKGETKMSDMVNHPEHYASGSVECIDALESAVQGLPPEQAICAANVIKYVWRYHRKNGLQDLQKAEWYLHRLMEKVE